MKKLITICLLLATAFTVKAQDGKPTFEQTLTYINTFFKDNSNIYYTIGASNIGTAVLGISAGKEGKIIFFGTRKNNLPTTNFDSPLTSFNLFDIKEFKNINGQLYIYGGSNIIGHLELDSESNSERIKKAFLHLKSLCNKESDPFGN